MKKYFLLFLIFIGQKLYAQDFEMFSVQSSFFQKRDIKEKTQDDKVAYMDFSVALTIPQVFNNSETILAHTLEYSNLKTKTELVSNNSSNKYSSDFHSLAYNLNFNQKLNDKWRINIGLSPTLTSDFEEGLTKKDFTLLANALLLRMKSERLNYGFGLVFSNSLGRELLLPFAVLNYSTGRKTLNVTFPQKISLMFNTENKNVFYGFSAFLNGAQYNTNIRRQQFSFVTDRVSYSDLNLGGTLEFRLKGGIYARTSFGMAMFRALELQNESKDTIDVTPKNGLFFNTGIIFYPLRGKASK
ncbi:hypothetical protein FUAX_04920 [Fulvitalea axinellae]|uniref:DUF6268 domain-containing protein n=1 Tax=Fulvitalea axinellae TaxID=1182444 RepID=A0AAU9CFN7_9BACT|nr:hypothetical protein FUAX_04920 [Fulvitalea axinellae]